MIVADTDVLIDALRGVEPIRTRVGEALVAGSLGTTAITAFELRMGAKKKAHRAAVESLLDALTILPLDDVASRRAADAGRILERDGRGIGTCDTLIAGICLENGARLLTRNRAHFERVAGLRIGATTD